MMKFKCTIIYVLQIPIAFFLLLKLNASLLKENRIEFLTRYNNACREAFIKKNDETYGIFHMLVDPPPPNIWKIYRYFLLSKNDF